MWLVKPAIDRADLQRVLAEFERPRTPVYAILPNRGAPPGKVRVLIDFLNARYTRQGVLAHERLVSESQHS